MGPPYMPAAGGIGQVTKSQHVMSCEAWLTCHRRPTTRGSTSRMSPFTCSLWQHGNTPNSTLFKPPAYSTPPRVPLIHIYPAELGEQLMRLFTWQSMYSLYLQWYLLSMKYVLLYSICKEPSCLTPGLCWIVHVCIFGCVNGQTDGRLSE